MMEPLVFEPYLRPQVWGHRRLGSFRKSLPEEGTFGESWEISGHAHHVSRVAEGPLGGTLLTDLCCNRAREVFGDQVPSDGRFPLLIKLLDCHDLLSIQVHPNDEKAARLTNGEVGKTECWVVLEASPPARIYAGLVPGTTPADLEKHLEQGTLAESLHSFVPKRGDCVFLPAGSVHAVGGGVVIAEVQQTSDATFRLFDWNRTGPDGKPRTLHKREALAAIDWKRGPVKPITPSRLSGLPSSLRGEQLVSCPYFILERYHVTGRFALPHPGRMSIWMLLHGSAELVAAEDGYVRKFERGETVLVPASAPTLCWKSSDESTLLEIRLPGGSA